MQPTGASQVNHAQPVSYNPRPHLERRFLAWLSEKDPKALERILNPATKKTTSGPVTRIISLLKPKKKKNAAVGFESLPLELKVGILKLLPLQDQSRCRAVNSEMREAVDDPRMKFWTEIESIKIQGEIPAPILDMVGGINGYLKLPILDLSRDKLAIFCPKASRKFESSGSLNSSRVRAFKAGEVPVFPARFIDEAGRYGLILGFKAGPSQKMIVQTLHEKKPRLVQEKRFAWMAGNTEDTPPAPMREDMEFVADGMRPCDATRFMKEIRENGRADSLYELCDSAGTLKFTYQPAEKK